MTPRQSPQLVDRCHWQNLFFGYRDRQNTYGYQSSMLILFRFILEYTVSDDSLITHSIKPK